MRPRQPRIGRLFRLPWRSSARIRDDVAEEISFHLEMRAEELMAGGLDPRAARERAESEFGDLEEAARSLQGADERIERASRRRTWLGDVRQDVGFAARSLRKRPAFTVAAVLTLAIGIGGTTIMFGALNALFLRPPPGVVEPDRVHRLYVVRREGNILTPDGGAGSYVDYRALASGTRGVEGVAAFFFPRESDYDQGPAAQRVRSRAVSGNFFSLLGVRPAVGRLLVPEDDRPGSARRVVVLGHGFWQREFGGDPDVVGRQVLLDGESYEVVGVAGPEFAGLDTDPLDVWAPLALAAADWIDEPNVVAIQFVARRASEASLDLVTSSAAAALAAAATEHPELDPEPGVFASPLNPARGPNRPESASVALWVGAATLLVLLIACANVANLMLARARGRRQEIAVRVAMGASRARIVRQLLTESVSLSVLAGAIALLLAGLGSGLVRQFPVLPGADILDVRMLVFALVASLSTGLLFGLAPAADAVRTGLAGGLKEARPGARPSRGRLRSGLVAGQVALSLLLLVGAGLFIRSLRAVVAIDPGVDVDRLAVATVDLRSAGYDEVESRAFYDRVLARLRALPGVEAASVALPGPLGRGAWAGSVGGEAWDTAEVDEGPYFHVVGTDFFRTAGTRIVLGRGFTEDDHAGVEPVVVLNERLARALAPGGGALGMCLPIHDQLEDGGCTRVVGIAENVRRYYLKPDPVPFLYLPRAQFPLSRSPLSRPTLVVRARQDPAPVLAEVRSAVQGLESNLPYVDVQRLEAMLGPELRPFRLGAGLFTVFGLLALGLAAVGLYGVLANLVAERTHEVGVRISLGATERQIVRLVVRQGLGPVMVGLVLGLGVALAGTRLVSALLYGTSPRDPLTLGAVAIVLLAAAALASWLPARRAARIDPVLALREE